jgi:hypothetical protein
MKDYIHEAYIPQSIFVDEKKNQPSIPHAARRTIEPARKEVKYNSKIGSLLVPLH